MIEDSIRLKEKIMALLNPRGRNSFLLKLKPQSRVFDIGSGNNSPLIFKCLRPDIYYVGLDVGNYNQKLNSIRLADEYVLTNPDSFHLEIENRPAQFDAVVCSHNIEHCLYCIDPLKSCSGDNNLGSM